VNAARRVIDEAVPALVRLSEGVFKYIKSRHERVLKQVCAINYGALHLHPRRPALCWSPRTKQDTALCVHWRPGQARRELLPLYCFDEYEAVYDLVRQSSAACCETAMDACKKVCTDNYSLGSRGRNAPAVKASDIAEI
jgi:hypothetical protein